MHLNNIGLLYSIVIPFVSCQLQEIHDSTYELFTDLGYKDIDYLDEPDWHGFWDREYDYQKNKNQYYIEKFSPKSCDITKDHLDCSKIPSSVTNIDIRKKGITNITRDSFPENNSIKVLMLISMDNLVYIEDEVFDRLIKLETLVITRTGIDKVPQFSKSLDSLKYIDLYENKIFHIYDKTFKHCPNLDTVNLGNNAISYVSPSAFVGTTTRLLTLSHNLLQSVPQLEGIDNTLAYIGLEHNLISVVGQTRFKAMDSLIHLNISYNPINTFEYACLKFLPNLRFLELIGLNGEADIPFEFLDGALKLEHITLDHSYKLSFTGRALEILPGLVGLSARYCGIKGLDFRSVQGTSSLTRLWLDGNLLSSFQHAMFIHGNFSRLAQLYLTDNHIKDIEWFGNDEFIHRNDIIKTALEHINSTSFSALPDLNILSLEGNQISQIRDGTFAGVTNLEKLYLSRNMLDDDSIENDAFEGLEKLQFLALDFNNLKSVPKAVYSLKSLETLRMNSNKLTFISENDFSTMEKLKYLHLRSNRILLIENNAFPDTIKKLDIAQNEFNFVEEEIFHNLIQISALYLSSNRITFLPKDIFSKNPLLDSIFLDNNFLKFINSSHFRNNVLSSDIIFNNNQIAYIGEASFSHVKQTGKIHLQYNELLELPNDGMFQNLSVSGEIRVDFNRLTHIKRNTFSNIDCSYFKINDNDITEVESFAFNKIQVKVNKDNPESFDLSNNPFRIIHEYAFNSISVSNQALFVNVKPLKIIPSLAFNDFVTNRLSFVDNELDMIEYKGFNNIQVKEQFILNNVGLKWLDRNAIVGSVQVLDLKNNNLRRIPESALFYITHNMKLHLQNNFIEIIESNALPNTKDELYLQNNNISLLTQSMFGNNNLTKDLKLQSNLINRVEENVFSGMIRLTDLNLGQNLLDDIPDDLFSGLTSLDRLILANNLIRHFGAQHDLPALTTIDLKINRLSQLESTLFESGVPSTNLPLQYNRLSCGCGLFSALEPVQKAVKLSSCNNPDHMKDVKLNWSDKGNSRYFLKVSPNDYICEPVDLTVEKVDETSFELSWQPPHNIQYKGNGATDYCFYDNCPSTQISYDAYCTNVDTDAVLSSEDIVISSLVVTHDNKLPYYCYVKLNYISNGDSLSSSYSQVVPYKSTPLPKDDLTCQDGSRCYTLTAEYFKFNKDVYLFNNYGPEKMVSSPLYKKNFLLNYLYKSDPQDTDDYFTPWYGPVNPQNLRTKGTLTLPVKITNGYKVDAQRFFPVDDNFNQFSRDCNYDVRPLGFTSKFYSSIMRTNVEVLKLGSVDEGWVYLGGTLLVELIAPEDNTKDVCSEIRLLSEYARVWIGLMNSGICEIDETTDEGTTIKIDGATKLEIFVSQRRNCASKLYLEMQSFNLVEETDYLNQEPTYIFETSERKPIGGFIATMDLTNPFTTSSYTIEILNDNRYFWFVDDSHDIVPDYPVQTEEDPGFNIPSYVPYKSTPTPTPLADTSTFTVHNDNVTIILSKVLDYRLVTELKISYRVTGTLHNANGDSLSSTGLILIKITDYNNNWPIPDQTIYTWDGTLKAISPEPLPIIAIDADATINAEMEYFIGETLRPDNETFYKEVDELYLYEDVMLDYQVTVHVVDRGTPRLGTTTSVQISISASCITTLDFEIVQASGEFYVTAPGYYLSTNPKYCDPCAAGYYCYGKGSRAKCTTCDQELLQPDGSIVIIDTDPNCNRSKTEHSFGGAAECSCCLSGWSCSDGIALPVLDKGKYIEPCTTVECPPAQDCPKGAACRFGVKYDCEPGTYSSTGDVCTFCPPGEYSDKVNSEQCDCCSVGYESSHKKSHCEPCAFNEKSDGCTKCMSCRNSTECPCFEMNPCHEGVQCVNKNGGYACLACPEGTEGDGQTCTDINECEVEGACFNDSCNNMDPGYECAACPEFYAGDAPSGIGKEYAENNKQVCEDVNECEELNGGCGQHVICINNIGAEVTCGACEEGYKDASTAGSEKKICERANKCEKEDICAEHAYCVYTQDLGYDCFCNIGYAGDGFNACGVDSDADGFPDDNLNCNGKHCNKDNCLNIPNISQGDVDDDNMGDACDIDRDEDGIPNEEDNCPDLAWTSDLDFGDDDGDGVGNACDNCPDDANTDQLNNDRDELGNACDRNKDNDAMLDDDDTCPYIYNSKSDRNDEDGIGDECDNCVYEYNPDQADSNENGYGDACDDGNDYDGDGVVDSVDNCVHIPNASQQNNDLRYEARKQTFTGDVCDNNIDSDRKDNDEDICPYHRTDRCFIDLDPTTPNGPDAPPNGPDADGDGTPDYLDFSYLDLAIPNEDGYFDFYDPASPLKSFVFDGVTPDNATAWKFDPINAEYSNEFYQLTDMSSPFVGVTFKKFADIDIWGTWFVKGDSPGNYIGFVFGFQNPRRFYLVTWRRTHLTYKDMTTAPAGGLRGLHIKSIHASYGKSTRFLQMLWHTGTEDQDSTLLWYDRNTVPWQFQQAYRWYLRYRPSIGMFSLSVYQAKEVIISTGAIYDNRILGGSFGVYAFDQPDTYWSNIRFHTEPRANGGVYLGVQDHSKIPLNLTLPTVRDSLLISLWFQINSTTAHTANTTLLCTDTGTLCIRVVNNGTLDDTRLVCRYGSVEMEVQVPDSVYTQRNSDKTAMWRNVVLEYVLPEYTMRLYLDNNLTAEVEDTAPQDTAYSEIYLGDTGTNTLQIDELRILEGRIEPEERAVVVSDPSMTKYIDQGRLVVWYDMNEASDSNTLVDRSGRGQHTSLLSPAVRCSTKSEGYMYNIQYNSAVIQAPVQLYTTQQFYMVPSSEQVPANHTQSPKRRRRRSAKFRVEL